MDHTHACELKDDSPDQKQGPSDDAVKGVIPEPVGEAADGHGEQANGG